MQRITWGGVALHAGVLPGYPASHGCIRMPESFAIKMWGWTKMGARVIVSPGELSPENFTHALLPTTKVALQPPVAEQPEAPLGAKADKGAPEVVPVAAKLELRSSVGHSDAAPLRDQTHTADASSDVSPNAPTMSDASAANGTPAHDTDAKATDSKPDTAKADGAKSAPADTVGKDTASTEAGTAIKTTEVGDAAKPGEAAAAAKPAEAKPATAGVAPTPQSKPAQADAASKPGAGAAKTEKPADAKGDAAKPANAASDTTQPAVDAKKDETRIVGDKPVKPDIKRKDSQIAVFISRKDSKLYVRQNFAPLFDVPITIAASDRPLGTHVFTAEFDKNDPNSLHWTVVTVSRSARAAMRASDGPHHSRRKGRAPVVEAKPAPLPDSPAEALDRITIPPDVMARIMDAMSNGGSIVVSDQGINQGETGEYTDFIIRTY
jgi:hypothetical protein